MQEYYSVLWHHMHCAHPEKPPGHLGKLIVHFSMIILLIIWTLIKTLFCFFQKNRIWYLLIFYNFNISLLDEPFCFWKVHQQHLKVLFIIKWWVRIAKKGGYGMQLVQLTLKSNTIWPPLCFVLNWSSINTDCFVDVLSWISGKIDVHRIFKHLMDKEHSRIPTNGD